MQKTFSFPPAFEKSISDALASYKLTLQDSKALAKSVQSLSDFFISKPDAPTPWKEKWAQIAYLCYYLPMNSARLNGLIHEADSRRFFQGLEQVIDFGAGLATASMTLHERHPLTFRLIERAHEPQALIESFFPQFKAKEWLRSFSLADLSKNAKTLGLFSYSLTELAELPDWAYQCEALMLVEPATQQDGRKLLQLRQKLIDKGFHIWAPCTHEKSCPLLTQSKTDWCHDRIHFTAPQWFLNMESHLPMKNRTLTASYILARKTAPGTLQAARTVGDRLREKGKDRQMICRGSEREFLAWMHKTGIEQEIPRGVLIEVPDELQKVSNELRVTQEIKVL